MRASKDDSDIKSKDHKSNCDKDRNHWRYGFFYHNASDPRIFLPKRIPLFGWTLNFAHTEAYVILSTLLGASIAVAVAQRRLSK